MKLSVLLALATATAFPLSFSQWTNSESVSVSGEDVRLLKLGENDYQIASEEDKLNLRRQNINFIDVTNHISVEDALEKGLVGNNKVSWFHRIMNSKQVSSKKVFPVYNYPTEVKHEKKVRDLFGEIDVTRLQSNLAEFTSFYTRYYKSETGVESANWLHDKISEIVLSVDDKVTITKVQHDGWDQYSIVVSIPGEVTDKVILGAHQDSINLLLPNLLKAPGADDDGSGTVTVLEALNILVGQYAEGSFKPYNTLEFHFYSAEEGGLLGSYDVFSRYDATNETVVGMLQQDMTGSTEASIAKGVEPHFGLITDYVAPSITEFLKLIIDNYNDIPYHETACGYACSDHASAFEFGYPSGFLIESEFEYISKYVHTVLDTVDRIDFDHVTEHVKLSIAFAYELSLAKKLH
ncbi:Zn-dependent exopeptidase [Suhomyces tanzawaensis NRRL Y-17324]|uniref:Peptide hydrolase n=1 Tax=Suhomyces tanzawaensis NRRL Y-17324 TaxID=984487 RepID=A0A1E4SMY2_9ASCO|nr:Zn-dependent exopeptidase [Suhomyces tanzawaensis NRRL Y-17324]ODV80855.1 Zn-dependent exopeptidase [Suhomyces tanzawaensis NRRL Y-17324]